MKSDADIGVHINRVDKKKIPSARNLFLGHLRLELRTKGL